jgi:Sulfate permease family
LLTTSRLPTPEPTFRELFTPKLVTMLREGYDLRKFQADALSGLTVAIVALPLSMAIAIASGVTPDRGLYTAIVAGFIISALGGSRFQIGGPAGAFIVLVAATVDRHGYDGLALATMMAGVILITIGFLRIGTYIKYIPHPVTIGFTAGIAVIIFASQLRELFGLTLPGKEPGPLIPKLAAPTEIRTALHRPCCYRVTGCAFENRAGRVDQTHRLLWRIGKQRFARGAHDAVVPLEDGSAGRRGEQSGCPSVRSLGRGRSRPRWR